MNVTPEVLAELRRLHLNATAAPWVAEEHMDGILTVETSDEAIWKRFDILQISCSGSGRLRGEFNGRFIAIVRNNIGALLDELEASRAELDRLRAALMGMVETCGQHVEDVLSRNDCPDEFAAIDAARAALGDTP